MSKEFVMMSKTDLIRGEGEWRNMQDVIRRSFVLLMDQNEQQQERIVRLEQTVQALQSAVALKPTKQELDEIVEAKLKYLAKITTRLEIDDVRQQLADVKATVERKASVRYVDDSLRKKLDKTSVGSSSLAKSETIAKLSDGLADTSQVAHDLASRLSSMEARLLTLASVESVRSIDQKVLELSHGVKDLARFDAALEKKADKSQLVVLNEIQANLSLLTIVRVNSRIVSS